MTSIENLAFYACTSLTSIMVDSENTAYDSRENCNAIIETSCDSLILACKNAFIPNSVKSIGDWAFANCYDLTSITIPESVTSIGESAFRSCRRLTFITIPNSVTSIGKYAFEGCSGLTSITIPNSVTSIGEYAFSCSKLTSITVESGNTVYDSRDNCNAIIETSSNTLISGCKNTVIPNTVTSIGATSFYYCSGLTSIIIPNSVTSIGDYAFYSCYNLTSITIPNSVTSIGNSAFNDCSSLTSITLPNRVTSIGEDAFQNCYGLTSITIPKSVTIIGNRAFQNCSGFTSMVVNISSPLTIESSTFEYCDLSLATLYVPYGCKAAYEAADYWKEFKEIVELPSPTIEFADANVKAICVANWDTNGDGELDQAEAAAVTDLGKVFYNKKDITSFDELQYFTGLTNIGDYAFWYCSGLTSITIPNGVTSIGYDAFWSCSGLTSITIPKSVTNIDYLAFSGCSGLTSITVDSENMVFDSKDNCNAIIEKSTNTLIVGCQNTVIPNSVTSIGYSAFYYCSSLTSITIPNSVTSIGDEAFSGCSSLTSVIIPNSVTSIGQSAFQCCSGLTSITIPNSVVSIGTATFAYCYALTSVIIPNGVTSISNAAFLYCDHLTSVIIPESVTSIGDAAFMYCSGLTSVIMHITSPLTISEREFTNRANATLYVPKNSKTAYAAADYWKDFKAIKEFPDPDVNQDGTVDVVDVVDVARFVVGTPSESFDQFLADLNGSGEVNVADAVVLVNEIAGDVNWARASQAPAISNGLLTLTRNADQSLSFSLEDNSAYTAFQFDLTIPEGMDVTQMTLNSLRKQNHQLLYNKIGDGHYRVVALSTSNNTFNGTAGELLCLAFDGQPADGIVIDNIHFVTAQGNDLKFSAIGISGNTPTSISGVSSNAINGKVYNLNGQRLTKAQKGLNIIDGKKVFVR